eukprot:GGOE01061663.1.p1 GENE.GGOE01061663.1~~GGOE01061663.1.p1  ORF type:complete len:411 (+),score=87.36 GGOE01061663.1:75-1235(+)
MGGTARIPRALGDTAVVTITHANRECCPSMPKQERAQPQTATSSCESNGLAEPPCKRHKSAGIAEAGAPRALITPDSPGPPPPCGVGFDLALYLRRKAEAVDEALDRYVPPGTPPHPAAIFDAMRHSVLACGKRIRPALVIAACEMVGGTQEMAMPTACALEMIHTMSLIHDDLPVMDNDDLRRGKPTCHKVFGEATALLAGDALLAQSFSLIASESAHVPPERIVKCIAMLGPLLGSEGLAAGQVADLLSQSPGESANVSLATVEYIHLHKTAALLVAAVCTGACIGGAGDDVIAALHRYATKVGLAYQITDDVLDAIGTPQQLGKAVGKDAKAGKATYVRVLGVEASRAMVQRLVGEAKAELTAYGLQAAPLLALADFIGTRQR